MEADVIAAMIFLGLSVAGFIVYIIFQNDRWAVVGLGMGGLFSGLCAGRLIDVLMAVQNLPC